MSDRIICNDFATTEPAARCFRLVGSFLEIVVRPEHPESEACLVLEARNPNNRASLPMIISLYATEARALAGALVALADEWSNQ